MATLEIPGEPARTKPSTAKTPHDDLRLPGGRRLGDVHGNLAALLVGIPGVSYENGRLANAEAYAALLGKIHDDGGRTSVAAWLNAHKGAQQ
jgi:hypothetical protein